MKRFIVLIISAALIASMLVISASAEQSNMEVNAPRFTKMPTFDGVISKEEWGEPTVHVRTDYAATVDSEEIGYDPELDVKNIFYWFDVEGYTDALAYDLWLRWDDDYFYMALVVEDPDPFSNPFIGSDMWNGDMVQFKIDTAGPSAAMLSINPDYDYHTDGYNQARLNYPWSSDDVCKGTLALSYGLNPLGFNNTPGFRNDFVIDCGALLGITCVTYEPESDSGFESNTISYEFALPWNIIDDLFVPETGKALGMSVAVGCSDADILNGWLTWGHGILHVAYPETQPRGTRGGSQAVILADDESNVTPADSYPVANEETAENTDAATPAETEGNAAATGNAEATGDAATGTDGESATKAPAATGADNTDKTEETGGLPTGAIIGIVAAVIVVIAAIAAVAAKKKK